MNAAGLAVLHGLQATGVRIVIDDVGAGYASLSSLIHFPYDKIKLDQSFAEKLEGTKDRSNAVRTILRAIIGICRDLNVVCLAEGIETTEQLAILKQEHCLFGQGFLFSQPVTAAEIPELLKKINGEAAILAPAMPKDLLNSAPFGLPFHQIAETAGDIIIVTTPQLDHPGPTIVYVNPAFTLLTGYTASEAIGATPRMLQGPGTSRATLDAISLALREGRPVHEKVLNFAKCGAPYWLDLRIVALRDAAGTITHFAAVERDVTMDKRRADELEVIADRDTLTGIPNRRAFLLAVEAEIEAAALISRNADNAIGPCLALIDVDYFKKINDGLGHAVGDAVLFGIADRLTENIRRLDMLGRIGGEEFGVCMPGVSLKDARALAEHLRRALAEVPIPTLAGPIPVTVSIGVSCFRAGDNLARLMGRADAAMYTAKRAGRDRVRSHSRQS
jgi:diguanylate cyclase (GGDEF)-like protein/PAS domain S-box-containing protein